LGPKGLSAKKDIFFVLWVFGLKMGFLGKFAHRGAQAARILKPPENGRAHFKAGFWTCGDVGAHF
jgi:hypothetical protein